jgi:hypothetical protein
MLSTRDVRHLRRADKAMRSLVAEHPWTDVDSTVYRRLPEWRSSFPAATAIRLVSTTLTKGQLGLLKGLTRFTIEGFHSKMAGNELPLAVVRTMPSLTALGVVDRQSFTDRKAATMTTSHSDRAAALALSPSARVWGELGGLRELTLTLALSALPPNFLSGLSGALRKLSLSTIPPPATAQLGGDTFVLTDTALTRFPLLEELMLCRVASWEDQSTAPLFSGVCLATLTRLGTLALTHSHVPPRVLEHACPALRSLNLSHCTGLSDETFTSAPAAVLSGIRALNLRDAPASVTSVSFAGLDGLEDLDASCNLQPSLLSEDMLRVLGSFGRLRQLRAHADTFVDQRSPAMYRGGGLRALARCPLVELDLLGPGHYYLPTVQDIGVLTSLRSLRLVCKELHGGAFLANLPLLEVRRMLRALLTLSQVQYCEHAVTTLRTSPTMTMVQVLDLTYCNGPLPPEMFSPLRALRSLNLSRCKNVSRELLCALPPSIDSLILDHCDRHITFDDRLLESVSNAWFNGAS